MNDKRYILPLIIEIKGFIVRNMINALSGENVQMKNKKRLRPSQAATL